MNAIEIRHLTKRYGRHRGIDDISLCVEEGDFFGFIGPNGAGKSTTIRTLLGLIKKSKGEAEILGFRVGKEKQEILKEVGYLPSEAIFYPGMKVKDILRLFADLHHINCKKERNTLCERLQLDVNKKVDELSFGNRKKVGIVCALQHEPSVLILDEPTSGLDPLMQKEFFEILKERNEKGVTIFLSSHILLEVQKYCKNAAIIREGKIIACDSVENLSNTSTKRVSVQGEVSLSSLEGIKDMKRSEEGMTFLYNGDMNTLLSQLSKGNIKDLTISEPDLDEIFMHYYE